MPTPKATKQAKPAPPAGPSGGVKKTGKGAARPSWRERYQIGVARKPAQLGVRAPGKVDLTHFVKWPKYVRIQRSRKILMSRMKVPPVIAQFSRTLDKSAATLLFKLLHSHRPETAEQKKQRLLKLAANKDAKKDAEKPNVVKQGIRHVTALVEQKKAKLVVIAHDVDPIDVVLWLPTLCKKKGIPYVIVKSKARLGQVVGLKTATCLAFVNVDPKDKADFANLVSIATEKFNDAYAHNMRTPGGQTFGKKHLHNKAKALALERAVEKQ